MLDEDRLLTAAEVAEYLRVPVARVYELGRLGALRPVRMGRQVRWLAEVVRRFANLGGTLAHGRATPGPPVVHEPDVADSSPRGKRRAQVQDEVRPRSESSKGHGARRTLDGTAPQKRRADHRHAAPADTPPRPVGNDESSGVKDGAGP